MDDIVRQAMAKWPNVPHCYGWLALDARGGWRMRDDAAQARQLPGEKIANPALLAFINRNYSHDEAGRWYFQNGPQRVYVDLEAAPFVARTDPAQGFMLHTGQPPPPPDAAWMTVGGRLLLQAQDCLALVDDRDLGPCLAGLTIDGAPVPDERLLDWLSEPSPPAMRFRMVEREVPVQRIPDEALDQRFGFVRQPRMQAG
jgi:hypothetical protein